MLYFLMHENRKLALIDIDEYYQIRNIGISSRNETRKYLPFLGKSRHSKLEVCLGRWLQSRGVPVTRKNIMSDLAGLKEDSVFSYMLANLGLSLTDHYWLNPQDSSETWESINLYTNQFRSAYSLDLADDEKAIAGRTNIVPSASLKGDLKKKWIIDQNGIRRLVKGTDNDSCRQSLCEVLATEIHKRQGKFEYVPYSLIEISSGGQVVTGCECPNFTSIETEFIPAIDIINNIKKPNEASYYETYIQYCGGHGIDRDYMRGFMEYQILTDFIITNTDRHFNNFGVIRDSRTLSFIKPAPIFDSGNSMFYNTNDIKTDGRLLDIKVNSFKKKEVKLLEYVQNPFWVKVDLLPEPEEVRRLFSREKSDSPEIVDRRVKAYVEKIRLLQELQGGIPIYSYHYLKEHNVNAY